ncbi:MULTISPECIES: RNA 2',3'-cyclic phosphodiesterase [unclassified Bacillus (in: firmicutes)]|uniref:RNA 2',3'-cyclic phosphodiesterase n=1 Tax=unclassified Bacillus (in: firmicutes) TaxID=185979 RepID=UPI0015CF70CE|nr:MULTISPECIES: RNA 2',3'-cyclic phosphodiesterase [unclassified Bacillus (in: firmicutes)]
MSEHYFLAVPLPIQIKEKLDDFSQKWVGKLPFKKWTFKDDFHITLSFLGPVTYTKSVELMDQLKEELDDFKSFSLTVQHLGIFGNDAKPRVWWFGLENSIELINLQHRISNICEKIGFSVEKRSYNPHITIAKKYNDIFDKEFKVPFTWEEDPLKFEADEIILYKIQPSKKPSYQSVASIKLK